MKHVDQRLMFTGDFDCDNCNCEGYVPDEFGSVVCSTCHGDGIIERECELRFDIMPGEAPITSGPPEHCDPGYGPEITKIAAFIDGKDVTTHLLSLDEADEFIRDKWSQSEVADDRADECDYSDVEDDHA